MHFVEVTHDSLSSFAIALPNNFTCWHFKKCVRADERLHIALVTSRAQRRSAYSNAELEKALLSLPERTERSRRARYAWLKRKVKQIA